MKRIILSAFITAFMCVSFLTINTGAATMYDQSTIVEIDEQLLGEKIKNSITKYYAVEIPETGILEIYFGSSNFYINHNIYTMKGISVESKYNTDKNMLTCAVKKGTYIVEIKNEYPVDNERTYNFIPVFIADKQPALVITLPSMNTGDTFKLAGNLANNDSGEKIKWKSSKNSIAKVSSSGKITAVSEGSAYITAYTEKSGLEFKIRVKVVK